MFTCYSIEGMGAWRQQEDGGEGGIQHAVALGAGGSAEEAVRADERP